MLILRVSTLRTQLQAEGEKLRQIRGIQRAILALIFVCSISSAAFSQSVPTPPPDSPAPAPKSKLATIPSLPRNILIDQKVVWTSPARLRMKDLNWIAPLAIATGTMIASDQYVPGQLSISPSSQKNANSFSNYGVAAFAGSGALLYFSGKLNHNEHRSTTGVMMAEAMIDSMIVGEVGKLVFQRERPFEGSMKGRFFKGGSSFPSEHAMLAWSAASVLATRYPGPLTKFFVYGGAAAISTSRVLADKHYPSDALIGSVLGYMIGSKVAHLHSETAELDSQYGTFEKPAYVWREANVGSPYVPIDSWIYPSLDRLQALGVIGPVILADRPWTRAFCAKLVDDTLNHSDIPLTTEESNLLNRLADEFSLELNGDVPHRGTPASIELKEVYSRTRYLSGEALTDEFHFGTTDINDYGRPFGNGWSNVSGGVVQGHAGPLSFFVQGEYQKAPSIPGLSLTTRQVISAADGGTPLLPATGIPSISRGRLLDAYVGYTFHNIDLTFGRQSLWWGPGREGGLLFSNNAEPVTMARLSTPEPFKMPSFLGALLGVGRAQLFLGQLDQYRFVTVNGVTITGVHPPPMITGMRLSFRPSQNFELGIGLTSLFGGPGAGFTPRNWVRSVFSTSNGVTSGSSVNDPGDRRASFDFAYKVPFIRNWMQLYVDSFVDDEVNPIPYPHRTAFAPGIYMPKLPWLPKMDLRIEGVYTDPPPLDETGFFYFNVHYRSGYTNLGRIMGYWVGRDGRGFSTTANYWFTDGSKLTAHYRDQRNDGAFAGGGRLQSGNVNYIAKLKNNFEFEAGVQYDRWRFPAFVPGVNSNTGVTIGVTYSPRLEFHGRK